MSKLPRSTLRRTSFNGAFALAICAAACTGGNKGPSIYWGANGQSQAGDPLGGLSCDPMVADECGFPFPSNVYLVSDKTTVTGWHVQFRKRVLPATANSTIDPTIWNASDGFSPGGAILTHMPGVDVQSMWEAGTLPSPSTINISVTTNSPTILLNAQTGALVPHWTELDVTPSATAQDGTLQDGRTLMIHPAIRLADNTRYIVAIRNMVDVSGKVIAPTATFKALRDGSAPQNVSYTLAGSTTPTTVLDPTVEPRRALYTDIFAHLSKAGIDKSNLQAAWDYTTASRENNTRDFLAMRDDALAKVGATGPTYTIPADGIQMNPDSHIYERIQGTMHVPLYLNQSTDSIKSRLVRDPKTNLPIQNGYEDWPFIISVPTSVYNSVSAGGPPAPVVQQGHGLFGDAAEGEGEGGEFDVLADKYGYVTLATWFQGFSGLATNSDPPVATQILDGDLGDFVGLEEIQQQGQLNQLLAMRMAIGGFVQDASVNFNGHPAIDPTKRYYRGDSQGGIMGAAYMAVSTDVTRGYLGEPGLPYNLLLSRSDDYYEYYAVLAGNYTQPGGRDIQLGMDCVQMLWDHSEPDGYAPYITTNTLPNTPSHNVLLNIGIGDMQVTPFGAYMLARTIGAQYLEPLPVGDNVALAEAWGIPTAAGPFTGNGMTVFNFHLNQNPAVTLPLTNTFNSGPDNCDPHDKVRQTYPAMRQQDEFFSTGTVQNFCSGALLLPTPLVNSCSTDSDCNDGNNRQDAVCTSGQCVEPAGSCDFDQTNGPMTDPVTPVACSPG